MKKVVQWIYRKSFKSFLRPIAKNYFQIPIILGGNSPKVPLFKNNGLSQFLATSFPWRANERETLDFPGVDYDNPALLGFQNQLSKFRGQGKLKNATLVRSARKRTISRNHIIECQEK